MKKELLSGILIFCAFQSIAQFRIDAVNGGGFATGSNAVPGTSIIVGNTVTATGTSNVIIGNSAGTAPGNTGNANTIIGQATAASNTSGWANTFLGAWTAGANTTGTANTFVGQYCGIANTTGGGNVFLGQGCATTSTTGSENTFLGTSSAGNNTSGSYNVFIGRVAGSSNTTGNSNIAIGTNANFGAGGLTNAIAIGVNSQVNLSNSMVLGGTGSNAVNVGIGTNAPISHLHTVNAQPEVVTFSTTNATGLSASTLNLTSPGILPNNNLKVVMNANTNTGTLLTALVTPPAPAISLRNMAGLLTNGTSLAIGIDGYEQNKIGNIHFINYVLNNSGAYNRTECMRINQTTGFVGIHTRSATSTGGSGDPQALFHVNLTNPAYNSLNPLTQGIRFEGLPTAAYSDVVVIDANGNLARTPYTSTPPSGSWLTVGNVTSSTEFIGTLTSDDFRIYTNNTPVARFTADGNFDLGTNSPTSTTTTSAAVGTNNTIDNSSSSMAVGADNQIKQSTHALASGQGNQIITSNQVAAFGDRDYIESSYASVVAGEDNRMLNGHGCFIGGGHSVSDGTYNLLLGNRLEAQTVPTAMPPTFPPLGFTSIMLIGEQIHSDLSRSLSIGFTGNRTMVTTQRGVAVQLSPTALSTYNPTVNFEVEAGVSTTGPMPLTFGVRSNIRFHNLPVAPYPMPAVVIDPTTGELFQTTNSYSKNAGSSGSYLDSLYKENELLQSRVAQLESALATYDEKFAQLEKSIRQICETGCGGMNTGETDALFQSVPNPSDNNVMINYYLARNYEQATISMYSMEGKNVRTMMLVPDKGNGSISIQIGDLQPGLYLYNLVVDGKQVDAKKLQKQ